MKDLWFSLKYCGGEFNYHIDSFSRVCSSQALHSLRYQSYSLLFWKCLLIGCCTHMVLDGSHGHWLFWLMERCRYFLLAHTTMYVVYSFSCDTLQIRASCLFCSNSNVTLLMLMLQQRYSPIVCTGVNVYHAYITALEWIEDFLLKHQVISVVSRCMETREVRD